MVTYAARRLLQIIPTLFGVTLILFVIFALAPSDYVDQNPAITPERAAELRTLYGLDKPVLERYWIWLVNVLQGDWGESFVYKRPVWEVMTDYMWNSLFLSSAAFILTWTLSIGVGAMAALRPYSWFDKITTMIVFVAMSMPAFFLSILALKLFAVDMRLFPLSGMSSSGQIYSGVRYVVDILHHMALPVIVLAMIGMGGPSRYVRSDMIEIMLQDYIRTARAKGMYERTVVLKHALRNALIPILTLMSFDLSVLFSGALITETIFNWPGIGRIGVEAIHTRDYPLLMGYNLFLAAVMLVCTLATDIVYGFIDPRIRYR